MTDHDEEPLLALAGRILREIGPLADKITIVGGLAPGLLVREPPDSVGRHAGTVDVDLGLSIAWDLDAVGAFTPLDSALRRLGFRPLGGGAGNRWLSPDGVVIDFLCGVPIGFQEQDLVYVTEDLAACAFSATPLAAIDRERVELTVDGRPLAVWVAGLGSFLALKVDALRIRRKPRDAYDIVWILRAWDGGPEGAAAKVAAAPIAENPIWTGRADVLPTLFGGPDSEGALRYAAFFDVAGFEKARLAVEAATTVHAFVRELKSS